MLKQTVGFLASAVAIAVVALILGVLVRLSWSPQGSHAAPSTDSGSSGPDQGAR
jgi:hypothetical protein